MRHEKNKKRGYHHLSFITTVALRFANDHDFEHLHFDLNSPAEGKIQGRQKKGVLSVYAIFPKERKKQDKKEKRDRKKARCIVSRLECAVSV